MLPKNQRLTSERDFKRVYQKGSFFSVDLFNINYLSNRLPYARLGIVITKKITSKSTERNLLKRRFREVARKIYAEIPSGFDVIIIIKGKAKEAKFEEIEKALLAAVPRVGNEKARNRHN
jgi:ribonuclease P protein component